MSSKNSKKRDQTKYRKNLLKTYSKNISQTIGIKFQRKGRMIGQQNGWQRIKTKTKQGISS